MNKENPKERDEKGDIKSDYKIDWQKIREDRFTYVFRYYDEDKKHYFPHFGLFSALDEALEKAKKDSNFYEKQIYWTPNHPPYDFFIQYHNWQLELLVEYFKEVFEERAFMDGYQPAHKYFKIILPKTLHDEIINCINDFELLPIRDLLFEVIAVAQDKYIDDVAFWELPEMQKLITSAEKETQKAIDIIQRLDEKSWMRGDKGAKKPSELLHINFAFNDGTVKIEHAWLAKEFVEHFKRYYADLHYKNWQLDLAKYPDRFKDNIKKQQFKYKLAKSFYNLLSKEKFFAVNEDEPTPNRLMLCISKLLEFCSITVAGADELDEIKIKNVRNWLNRNELEPAITFLEVPANNEKLLKYFESEFIHATHDVKRADALSIAAFLSKKYNVDHLLPDLAHIAQAIIEGNWLIGHQLFAGGLPRTAPFEEFESFRKLIKGVKQNQKIASLKFKIEGDETEHELKQRLPIYLIEEAIKEYSDDHQVEMDTDLISTDNTQFKQPEERFMVRFVNSFYTYLLAEAPPAENEYIPSERYYGIIADMLQKTWFFYHQRHPDWFTIVKVKQWHKLGSKK